jgi:7-cyano-7-deazaguanine reductase
MATTDVSGLKQLGSNTGTPQSPDEAILEKVPTENGAMDYVVRFVCPEFTSLCPMTGQPDFAHIVIDYVPDRWLVESKSLKLFMHSFRNHGAFHEDCTMEIAKRLTSLLARRNGSGSAPTGIRAAAFRSTSSGRAARRPSISGCQTRACRPIAAAAETYPNAKAVPASAVTTPRRRVTTWLRLPATTPSQTPAA